MQVSSNMEAVHGMDMSWKVRKGGPEGQGREENVLLT